MKKTNKVNLKILILGAGLTISVCALIGRLYILQIAEHEELLSKSEKQYRGVVRIKRDRGIIYDRNLKELAVSVKAYSVFANPKEIDNIDKTSSFLAWALKIKKENIINKLKNRRLKDKKGFVWIKRKALPDEIERVKSKGLKGVGFIEESDRFYPRRELAANVIGFVGVDNQGLAGLEYEFNDYIEGEEEIVIIEKDAKGRSIKYAGKWLNTSKGCDLITTIDEVIQHIAEKELKKAIDTADAKEGVVIVMEPSSGDILAIANYPSFNPNSFNKYGQLSWTNRTVTYSYEPGSTFKLILAAAAIEENLVRPDDLFYCENGQIEIGGIVIHDTHKYKWMTAKQIIGKSSNIGAVKIGKKIDKELFYEYIDKFGFGKKTNIDLPGESHGILKRPARWSRASLGAISIGHEIAVTPIQLITALSAVANEGVLTKPRIVKTISKHGSIVKEFPSKPVKRVISKETGRKMTDILKYVVTDGTGVLAAVDGYPVAGKTGTAQKIDPETKSYSKKKFVASFIGYLPADAPVVSILVMIDEPKNMIYGGKAAAPVFRKIAAQVMRYLRIAPKDISLPSFDNWGVRMASY